MRTEDKVVSLETAKLLKAAGFPQKYGWCWTEVNGRPVLYEKDDPRNYETILIWYAPDVSELLAELPMIELTKSVKPNVYICEQIGWVGEPKISTHDNPAEALANLWLKLTE